MLKEIVIYGRGGQGAVTSSYTLAKAFFYDNLYSQAFPSFGVERTGAPVEAYVRFSDEPIRIRQHVYSANYAVILDSSLIKAINVREKLKNNAMVFINSSKQKRYFGKKINEEVLDVTAIALEVIGKPFVNIASLGMLASANIVSMKGIEKAIYEMLPKKLAKLNYSAAKKVYEKMKGSEL